MATWGFAISHVEMPVPLDDSNDYPTASHLNHRQDHIAIKSL